MHCVTLDGQMVVMGFCGGCYYGVALGVRVNHNANEERIVEHAIRT